MQPVAPHPQSILKLGFWPIRGKAQVPRLILSYFQIPYQNQLHIPKQWYPKMKNKQQQFKGWDFISLPYLKDNGFIVTDTIPIIIYILKKYGHQEFLGKDLKDQTYIQTFLWHVQQLISRMISLFCSKKSEGELIIESQKLWKIEFEQKLTLINNCPLYNQWYVGYLTVADLSIYQLVHYMKILFPNKIQRFKNLIDIQVRVGKLDKIIAYESDPNSFKQFLPTKQFICQLRQNLNCK